MVGAAAAPRRSPSAGPSPTTAGSACVWPSDEGHSNLWGLRDACKDSVRLCLSRRITGKVARVDGHDSLKALCVDGLSEVAIETLEDIDGVGGIADRLVVGAESKPSLADLV